MNLMISRIISESEFKRKIEEKKNVNEFNKYNKNDNKNIFIHFERSSNNIEENKRNIEKSKNKDINQEPLLSKSTIIKLNQEQKPEEKR